MANDDWHARYEALAKRNEQLEREVSALRARLVIADGKSRADEDVRLVQSEIVQREVGRLNAQLQDERVEIERLRAMLRGRGDAD